MQQDVPGLAEVLAPDGWANASSASLGAGDPGRYNCLFGRDSLITALAVLPARPDVAAATLRALAAIQGTREDVTWDEEPGKIVHEVRPGISVARQGYLGLEVPDGELRYYGSADSTPLFLHVLAMTGDAALAAELEPAWRAAGDWLLGALERGGGLLRWHRRAPGGLVQQGWRDTVDPIAQEGSPSQGSGIVHEDGSAPEPPVADGDTQAAALAGLRGLARLSGDDGARGRRRGPGGAHRRGVGPRHDGARRARPARARGGLAAGLAAVGRGAGGRRRRAPGRSPTCSPTSACARSRIAIRTSTRSPTTVARCGRSTRGWAGAGCAPPGMRRRPSASVRACWRASSGSGTTPSSTR